MFGLSDWNLSRAINKQIGSLLDKQARKLLSNLKDLQSATLNDACDAIADSQTFQNVGIPAKLTTDRILQREDATNFVELSTVPIETLSTSPILAQALASKLKTNVPLKAAANELGVDLNNLLTKYCPAFLKHAMPQIIQRLIDDHKSLYAGYVVVALAEAEAYELGGDARRRDMVKFFSPSARNSADEIQRATKFWNKRSSSGYDYKRNIYGK